MHRIRERLQKIKRRVCRDDKARAYGQCIKEREYNTRYTETDGCTNKGSTNKGGTNKGGTSGDNTSGDSTSEYTETDVYTDEFTDVYTDDVTGFNLNNTVWDSSIPGYSVFMLPRGSLIIGCIHMHKMTGECQWIIPYAETENNSRMRVTEAGEYKEMY